MIENDDLEEASKNAYSIKLPLTYLSVQVLLTNVVLSYEVQTLSPSLFLVLY